MNGLLKIISLRCRSLFRRGKVENELDREIQFHIDMLTQEKIENGLDPVTARKQALSEFGHADFAKEECRDSWGNRTILETLHDFRFGMRLCARFPASSVMAVLVLSMGVALAAMMYTMASAIMDRGTGIQLDERLLSVEWETGQTNPEKTSVPDFKRLRSDVDSMENFVGIQYSNAWVNLPTRENEGEQYNGLLTTSNFFDLTDTIPTRGNLFSDTTDSPVNVREAIISDSIWMNFFDRSDSAIGERLVVSGMNCVVVGVMPAKFDFPRDRHIWISTDWREYDGLPRSDAPQIGVVGRLKNTSTIEQAKTELEIIATQLATQFPDTNETYTRVRLTPYREMFVNGEVLIIAVMILLGSLPVLLFACVNVFNIIMARTASRTHELAVRTSMGAKRSHIIWQVVVDGLTLALFGAVLGIALASLCLYFVSETLSSFNVPGLPELSIGPGVIGLSICAALLSGAMSSFIPAWRASRINSFAILKDDSRSSTSIFIGWLSKAAVVSQVAFSGVLLFLSIVLLIPSLFIDEVEMPFDEASVLTSTIKLWTDPQFKSPEDINRFYQTLKQELNSRPGVEATALTSAGYGLMAPVHEFEFEGETQDSLLLSERSRVNSVTIDFLEVFDVKPTSGRALNIFDTADSTSVCMVNQNFVNTHCKHLDPTGMRLKIDPDEEDSQWVTIVGVIPSLKPKELGWGEDVDSTFSEILLPSSQRASWNLTLLLKASNAGKPEFRQAVKESIRMAAPMVRLSPSFTIGERIDVLAKVFTTLSTVAKIFGVSILAMSLIGLYAIVTFATTQRRREFGIRLAIGSTGLGIAKAALKPWAITIGSGLILAGIASATLLGFYLVSNSDGEEWTRYVTPAAVAAGIICIASSVAMLVPAWRATKIDPATAMRSE